MAPEHGEPDPQRRMAELTESVRRRNERIHGSDADRDPALRWLLRTLRGIRPAWPWRRRGVR